MMAMAGEGDDDTTDGHVIDHTGSEDRPGKSTIIINKLDARVVSVHIHSQAL